jgi:S-adenosylmethionine hydrolase
MREEPSRIIAFLSDFGLQDGYVAEVHGVLLGIDSRLRVIDVSHLVPPGEVRTGAFLLYRVRSAFPPGTVLLGVVDPGVGTDRRPLAVRGSLGLLGGPDNGLLGWAADDGAEWREIDRRHRSPRSAGRTFDGRDLFAPVAGALASGTLPFEEVGPRISDPLRFPFPSWSLRERTLRGEVLHVDRFGNVLTSIPGDSWRPAVPEGSALRIRCGGASHPALHGVYQDSPGLTVHPDSSGFLEVSLRGASAAAMLHLGPGDVLEVAW